MRIISQGILTNGGKQGMTPYGFLRSIAAGFKSSWALAPFAQQGLKAVFSHDCRFFELLINYNKPPFLTQPRRST